MLTALSKADDNGQVDFELDLMGILHRRYAHIALGVLAGASLAALFYFQQSPVYESELAVLVGQRSSELASTGFGNSMERATVQDETLSTHMELFSSHTVLEDAIACGRIKLTVKDILEHLSVSKGGAGLAKNASVLKATYQDPDAEQAARVLRAIFDSYLHYIEQKSQNVGQQAATLISNSLVESEEALQKADRDYRNFIANIPALITSDGDQLKDVHAMRLHALEEELANVQQSLAQARSRLQAVKDFSRGKKPDQLTDIDVMTLISEEEALRLLAIVNINNPQNKITSEEHQSRETNRVSTEVEYQKLLDLISKREQLESKFGAAHPSYRAVVQEINSVQRYIDRARQVAANQEASEAMKNILVTPAQMLIAYVSVLESEIREGAAREKGLLAISEEEAQLAKETETSYLLSVSLKNEVERARRRYDEVFARLQEINLTNSSSGFSTDLIVPPVAAEKPVWPSKIKIGILGLLVGSLLGLGFAFMAELTDHTFRNPSELEHAAGAIVLAHIPKLAMPRQPKIADATSGISPLIATYHDPCGLVAETFRALRTSVVFSMKKEGQRTLMVTSPSPADGKSTTIANLAVSLAQAGRQVLLVDGDLRRPSIGRMFGLKDEAFGLSDYLRNDVVLADCCHACGQFNLTICPNGTPTSIPADLLQSDRLAKFLAEARKRFDFVLIDTPPLLAVADPAIISDVVDGCLMVLRVEKNSRSLIDRARAILTENDVNVDGVVVNSSYAKRRRYGYSSYKYDGYRECGFDSKYHQSYTAQQPNALITFDNAQQPDGERRLHSASGHASTANTDDGHRNGDNLLDANPKANLPR